MDNIRDKIAKLLALAGNNPNESEAKAAILKARALMAEHKLRPEECVAEREEKVVQSEVGISCTARKYSWGAELAAILAAHYCCISFRNHRRGTQTQNIGFAGLESDFEICSRIYRYAFDCVKQASDEIFKEEADWLEGSTRRKQAEAYGWGFCAGLKKALNAQKEEHQEWGLVMVVPPQVQDVFAGKKATSYGKANFGAAGARSAGARGYQDGLKFDPATRLADAKAPLALAN